MSVADNISNFMKSYNDSLLTAKQLSDNIKRSMGPIKEIKMNTSIVKKRYAEIIDELYTVFDQKLNQYGTGMYEEHSDAFKYWSSYFNIRRKTLRLETLTIHAQGSDGFAKESRAKLIDDYKDIANYAIMAVQILEEKDDGV